MTTEVETSGSARTGSSASKGHLGEALKAAYGTGQCVKSLAIMCFGTLQFFYLTNVCGLWGRMTGLALLPALGVDAIAGPLMKSFSDGLTTCFRQRLSGFFVPFIGRGAEIADDFHEHSSVVAFRALFGIAVTVVGYVLSFWVLLGGGNCLTVRAGHRYLGFSCGTIILALALITAVSLSSVARYRASHACHALFQTQLSRVS